MSSNLIQCIYASAATRSFQPHELADLLRQARENNARLGLTGMLLHADGSFFQVLEGPAEVVDALYATIEQDRRHGCVTQIIREPIHKRHFDRWSMGFCNVSREELEGLAGVNDFFAQSRPTQEVGEGRARKLLMAFRDGRWRQKLSGESR